MNDLANELGEFLHDIVDRGSAKARGQGSAEALRTVQKPFAQPVLSSRLIFLSRTLAPSQSLLLTTNKDDCEKISEVERVMVPRASVAHIC